MATPVTFGGVSYSIPAFGDVGWAQGPGNVSAYLIALASGTPQTTGGLFSLTAPLNFGPNFGILAVNFSSTSSNRATSGQISLANTDTIAWRNFANSGNLALGVNASNQLTFNGSVIGLVGGSVTSVTGTANQINSTGGTTPVLSLSSTLVFPGTATGTLTGHSTLDLALTGGTMSGAIAMGASKITGLAAATANGDALRYEQLIGLYLLLTGGTMSGAIAMGANKITGLANGTVATDAVAFGQMQHIQTIFNNGTTSSSLTSATYTATVVTASITPTSAASRIKITMMFMSYVPIAAGTGNYYIARGTTKLGAGSLMIQQGDSGVGVSFTTGGAILSWVDSPATTSATAYTLYGSNANAAGTITIGNGATWSVILEEIV